MVALLVVLAGGAVVLAAGCLTADKLFPRVPLVERFIESLPMESGKK